MLTLVCRSDTTIGETVGTVLELGPDVWGLEREAVKAVARGGIAWYASQVGAAPVGPIYWRLIDVNWLTLEEGKWG